MLTSPKKRSNAKDLDGDVRKPVKINQFGQIGQIMRYDLIWLDSTVNPLMPGGNKKVTHI